MKRKITVILTILLFVSASIVYAINENAVKSVDIESKIQPEFWVSQNPEFLKSAKEKIDKMKEEGKELRGEACPLCELGSLNLIDTQYGSEEYDRFEPCKHKPGGADYYYKTPVYKSYRCNRCGNSLNTTTYKERMECRGV